MFNLPKLTIKQTRFVAEYLKDGNASRAYREAYDTKTASSNCVEVSLSPVEERQGRTKETLIKSP